MILLAAIIVGIVLAWLVPRWQTRGFEHSEQKLSLENELRRTLVQGMAGLAVVGSVYLSATELAQSQRATAEQSAATAQREAQAAFDRAVQQLSGGAIPERVTAIARLGDMAEQGEAERELVLETLSAFVRDRRSAAAGATADPIAVTAADLQAALYAITQRRWPAPANLRSVNLAGADLSGALLDDADLRSAILEGALLVGARLRGARLDDAVLIGADLEDAALDRANLERAVLDKARLSHASLRSTNLLGSSLQGANLYLADLEEATLFKARLEGARLTRANLRGATLSGARVDGADFAKALLLDTELESAWISQSQLNDACVDTRTRLDEGLVLPPPCPQLEQRLALFESRRR